ncbi:MAG: indolepyruvate oxidoreductase subunit beta family protein [Candidatus Nanopelagicales bacterium]|nr:indolepyruvate oxidoreductase subunit beta family protein [Candidatus Nanopelagicales bacterium]
MTVTESSGPAPTVTRPITMAIMAMGGEGGGVLADWVVKLAEMNGYFAQNTSVAGVAQRTGATVYYVELLPKPTSDHRAQEPILSTMPTPGHVDIVVASELMESGRAIQRGFCTPERTTLIASTNRVYSMPERTAMGDGRIESQEIIEAAKSSAKRFIRADFNKLALDNGSVISASLFGAIAAAQVIPFTREQCEDVIRTGGKGIEASLATFKAGFDAALASERPVVGLTIGTRPPEVKEDGPDPEFERKAIEDPTSLVGPKLQKCAERIFNDFPSQARYMLVEGIRRCAEYQDVRYAEQYLDRVAQIAEFDTTPEGKLTLESARYTALWMTYEDTIRVAFHKTRKVRFDRVKKESRATESEMVQIREFLHPQIEEITDTLPTPLGRWLLNSKPFRWLVYKITNRGIKIQTSSVWGFTVLYLLAKLRPLRRRSLRFGIEQERIDAWLTTVVSLAGSPAGDQELAYQVCLCQQLIKGYGDTHANGLRNFNQIIDYLAQAAKSADPAKRIQELRASALSDETGAALQQALGKFPS